MDSLIRQPTSNYEAMVPLRVVTSLVGLTPISYTDVDITPTTIRASHVLETIYKLTVLAVYYVSVYYSLWHDAAAAEFDDKNFIAQVAAWTQTYLVAVVSLALIAFNLIHRRRLVATLRELDAIDAALAGLGVDVAYGRLRSEVVLTIACAAALVGATFACEYLSDGARGAGYWIGIFFPVLCYCTLILQFVDLLTFARYRFALLNGLFSKLFVTARARRVDNFFAIAKSRARVDDAIASVKMPGAGDAATRLDAIFELHDRLYEVSKTINFAFGFQVLLCLTISFISILSRIYDLVKDHGAADTYALLAHVAWTATHVVIVFVVVWSTDATAVEANDTRKLLHRARNRRADLKGPTEMYTLQLLHQRVGFSACGFFSLDYTLLYSIIGALTTYLVILIQFDMTIPSDRTAGVGRARNDSA